MREAARLQSVWSNEPVSFYRRDRASRIVRLLPIFGWAPYRSTLATALPGTGLGGDREGRFTPGRITPKKSFAKNYEREARKRDGDGVPERWSWRRWVSARPAFDGFGRHTGLKPHLVKTFKVSRDLILL